MREPTSIPWLVLIHQLPPKPSYLRVKIWRRLQGCGAVPIKNSVYVLPNTEEAREDFEWVLREIRQEGGEASLVEARLVDGLTDDDVRASFQTAREADYGALAEDIRAFAREAFPKRLRTLPAELRGRVESELARFRKRLADIGKRDFYAAPGREAVEGLLEGLDSRLEGGASRMPATTRRRAEDVADRVWVTRTGVHIDRMASAWLIRRFIDHGARFKFVASRGYTPERGELRFDMFEAEFTHQGELCTFEVLLRTFGIDDPALVPLAEIIHDIDVKEATYGRAETAGVEHLVAGVAWINPGDEDRIAQSSPIFEALYGYFQRRKT